MAIKIFQNSHENEKLIQSYIHFSIFLEHVILCAMVLVVLINALHHYGIPHMEKYCNKLCLPST